MKKISDLGLIILAGVFVILITGIAFLAGYLSHIGYTQFDYKIFEQVYVILEENGLKPMPEPKITEYEMIRGLVRAYDDPYTVFVEPVQHEIDSNQLEGKFGGVGAEIQRDLDGRYRLYPYPDSPAASAGIPEACILVSVDGVLVQRESSAEEVVSLLRGDIGSRVEVTCTPNLDTAPITKRIVRQEFPIPSVAWHILPEHAELGLVKISGISAATSSEITQGVNELVSSGAKAVILDLRGNGGGLVDASIDVVELFMPENTPIIKLHYPDSPDQVKNSHGNGKFSDIPLYIFIDQNTASSAEIVAGALQASSRATLIGVQTYGKDTIQLVFDLEDGSSIHVSAARWSLPGNPGFISGAGILPDIPLPPDQLTDQSYIQALLQIY